VDVIPREQIAAKGGEGVGLKGRGRQGGGEDGGGLTAETGKTGQGTRFGSA
jgi:hypothetical protein